MSQVRWGILGTGRIAHDFVTSLLNLRDGKVVAVGSRGENSAKKFAEEHNIPRYHSSYKALVEDPEVDVVYIATPNSEHFSHLQLALASSAPLPKAVVCEKTITTNSTQAKQVIELAREKNVFLMEANWMMFFPLFLKFRKILDEGLIGEVQLVQADLGFKNSQPEGEGINDPKTGGGAFFACGIYLISLATVAFGGTKPSQIQSSATLNPKTGVDETTTVLLSYEQKDGRKQTAVLVTSIVHFLPSEAIIRGTKGEIKLEGLFCCATRMRVKIDGQKEEVFEQNVPENPGSFNFPNSSGLVYEAQEVVDCLKSGQKESPKMKLNETLLNAEIMDEVRRQIGLRFPYE